MPPLPDAPAAEGQHATPRSARLLGWFLAVNAVAALLAVLGAAPAATEAAGRIAWWCGIR